MEQLGQPTTVSDAEDNGATLNTIESTKRHRVVMQSDRIDHEYKIFKRCRVLK